jgi:hypothetical protein
MYLPVQPKVTFRDLRSGHLASYSNENDIAHMRKHAGYVELKESQNVSKEPENNVSDPLLPTLSDWSKHGSGSSNSQTSEADSRKHGRKSTDGLLKQDGKVLKKRGRPSKK